MSTQTKPRSRVISAKPAPKRKSRIYSPAIRALRKHILHHDADQWKKDLETGAGEY